MGYPISRDYLATQFVNYDKLILQPRFKTLTDSADAKVPIKQTVADAGKLLVVGADGNVTLQATTDATTIGKEPINGTALQAAIGALDCAEVGGGARQYIASVKQVDGVLAATAATLPTTIDGYGITDAVYTKQLGTASTNALIGIATLNENGKVPSSQLPAYVDDVLEYTNYESLPSVGEGGIIYVALDKNKTYRWSGSDYVEISASLALGETDGTAYPGHLGKKFADQITSHIGNLDAHVTANDKTAWNAKQTALSGTQLDAVNSGITAAKVTTYDGYAATIGTKSDKSEVDALLKDNASKNLLEVTASSFTRNGVTFTVNNDKTISLSGTAVSDQSIELGVFTFKANEKYIVSGSPTGGAEAKYFLYSAKTNLRDYGAGRETTFSQDTTESLWFIVKSGTDVTGLTIKPMIRRAEIKDDSYEPYYASNKELTEIVKSGSVNSAEKLANPVNIGKASFNGGSDITVADIMGRGIISSSGTEYVNKWAKFATIDLSTSGGYSNCNGIMHFTDNGISGIEGLIYFYVGIGSNISNHTIRLRWISLSDTNLKESLAAVKVSDGIFELYFKPVTNHFGAYITLLDCNRPNLLVFLQNQSYVDSVEAVVTSSLSGYVERALKDGNGNKIDETYLPLTGGTLSGHLEQVKSDASSVYHVFQNSVRRASVQINAENKFGLYDHTNSKWIHYTNPDGSSHFVGLADKATQDGNGKVIADTYATNTSVDTKIASKVDKVSGKGLSTNDYTTAEKTKLAGIAEGANAYTHPNSGVTAGTYRSVTVNAAGHITAGSNPTLAVSEGGTGKTTANAAANAFINALTTGSAAPQDADYFISQYAGGGTTNTEYIRKPVSTLWTYIKGKADSTYAAKSHGTHVPSVCTLITDWNNATSNGWYMGNNASNAPVSGTYWFYGEVIAHNTNYVRQIVYKFANDAYINGANCDRYERAKNNGTWGPWVNTSVKTAVPSDAKFTDTTYSAATQSAQGLMSAADKTKLDGIATGANKTTVDSALSSSSTNPVANKAVNTALNAKANKANITGGTFYSTVVNTQGIVTGGDTGLTIPTTAPATVKAGSMWISV